MKQFLNSHGRAASRGRRGRTGFFLPCAGIVFLLAAGAQAQLDHSLPLGEQAEAGKALAEKWRDAAPGENVEYNGAVKIRNSDGDVESVPLKFKIVLGAPGW